MFDRELRNIVARYSVNIYSCAHTLHLNTKCDNNPSIRRYSFFTKNRDDELPINYNVIQPETNSKQIAVDVEKIIKTIPAQIEMPSYAHTSVPIKYSGDEPLSIWNEDEIRRIRKSCKIAKYVLREIGNMISRYSESSNQKIAKLIIILKKFKYP